MSRGFGSASAVEIATQYVEGSVELAITGYTESQRHAEYPQRLFLSSVETSKRT